MKVPAICRVATRMRATAPMKTPITDSPNSSTASPMPVAGGAGRSAVRVGLSTKLTASANRSRVRTLM